MNSVETHVNRNDYTIKLRYDAGVNVSIPLEPTGPWSLNEYPLEDGRAGCHMEFNPVDFAQVLDAGVFIGRKHVLFRSEEKKPEEPRHKKYAIEQTVAEQEEILDEPVPKPKIGRSLSPSRKKYTAEWPYKIVSREPKEEQMEPPLPIVPAYRPPSEPKPLEHPVKLIGGATPIGARSLGNRPYFSPTSNLDTKPLRVKELTKAIQNSVDHPENRWLKEEEAKELALHVLGFFGYSDEIIDNILEPDDRDAFYMLEDNGLLSKREEPTTLYDGREWRIFYWILKRKEILELATKGEQKEKIALKHESDGITAAYSDKNVLETYSTLPEDVWEHLAASDMVRPENKSAKMSRKRSRR